MKSSLSEQLGGDHRGLASTQGLGAPCKGPLGPAFHAPLLRDQPLLHCVVLSGSSRDHDPGPDPCSSELPACTRGCPGGALATQQVAPLCQAAALTPPATTAQTQAEEATWGGPGQGS